MAAILDFISVFGAGSSVYNFRDNLFKIRRNEDDDNICDLTRGFFFTFMMTKKLWLFHLSMVDKFQKCMKIKNFVSSNSENYKKKICNPHVSDHPSISRKYWVEKWRNSLFGFLTSSSTTRLYRGRAPRQSVWQFYVLPHMRQSWETMTSVSAGHIILTPTQPVGSGRRESNPGSPQQESRALPTELPRPLKKFWW